MGIYRNANVMYVDWRRHLPRKKIPDNILISQKLSKQTQLRTSACAFMLSISKTELFLVKIVINYNKLVIYHNVKELYVDWCLLTQEENPKQQTVISKTFKTTSYL